MSLPVLYIICFPYPKGINLLVKSKAFQYTMCKYSGTSRRVSVLVFFWGELV